jgi:hypothetical protein
MIYRKQGRSRRWENGTVIDVEECGLSREENGVFSCEPDPSRDARSVPFEPADLHAVAEDFRRAAGPCRLERLLLVDGSASHEFGDRRWRDTTRRVHAALTHEGLRARVDLGNFDSTEVERIAAAFARIDPRVTSSPAQLRLAPPVGAAILHLLAGSSRSDVRVVQSAGGVDGRGEPIEAIDLDAVRIAGMWPNWHRPSYRVAPQRAPFNLRAEGVSEVVEPGLPCAVTLLAPPAGLTLRVLVDDGSKAWPATVEVRSIRALASSSDWYPYGAGSFGAEMML